MINLWQTACHLDAEEIDTPLVVIHRDVLKRNVEAMATFAKEHGVQMRPHLKTHKTLEIARLQHEAGVVGLTCAKLGEAEVFLANGFHSLLIAYPLVGEKKMQRLFALTKRYPDAEIQTLVDNFDHAAALSKRAVEHGITLPIWVKIDSGLHRVGVLPGATAVELVSQLLNLPGVRFLGLLTHAGHAYGAPTTERVQEIGHAEAECLLQTAEQLRAQGIEVPGISVGSTPTVRISGSVPGVTEIRPGNYVFNDATQIRLGAATAEQCSLRVFTRVVSRPAPDRIVIDAGAKTLALDKGAHGSDALQGYGLIVGHPDAVIERLSEEHGVAKLSANSPIRVGDVLEIIPNHSCPVANLTDDLFTIDSDGNAETWQVIARGKTR